MPLYSTWRRGRKILRRLRKGEVVTALTGIYITFRPDEYRVIAPLSDEGLESVDDDGLKPGDTIFGYMNRGEGALDVWFKGHWVPGFYAGGFDTLGCNPVCTTKLLKRGRSEWWVKLKTKEGTIGWTKDGYKFDLYSLTVR